MPTTIRYDGPLDAVEVPLPSGLVVVVERGQTSRFTDDLAARLLQQSCWSDPTADQPKGEARRGSATTTTDTSGAAPQED